MSERWAAGSDRRWRRFRLSILERDQWTCTLRVSAKCTGKGEHVHHIVPLASQGEKYDPANCASACAPCNLQLGNRAPNPQPSPEPRSTW